MINPLDPGLITSVEDFITNVRERCARESSGAIWIYRGQTRTSDEWPLIPKAGRKGFFRERFEKEEMWKGDTKWTEIESYGYTSPWDMKAFSEWRREAVAIASLPENDEWECLAMAQHYGLGTRLLDWTRNPLVALFFACVGDSGHHYRAVYAYPSGQIVTGQRFSEVASVITYEPRPFDRRIASQRAVFTYHPNPIEPLERAKPPARCSPDQIEFLIPADALDKILIDLAWLGITRSSLFPDLEGLSWDVNYRNQTVRTIHMRPGLFISADPPVPPPAEK